MNYSSSHRHFTVWALMLLAGPAAAVSWPTVPTPAHMRVADVSRHMIYNGVDMRAQIFRSSRDQAALIGFYRRTWKGEVKVRHFNGGQVISHKQGDYFITVQVRNAGGGSKGQIGIIDLATAPRHVVLGKGVPRPMGAKVFNDIRYPDDRVPARTIGMQDNLSPRQNATFFREHLEGQGWKPADSGKAQCNDDSACVQRYARGDGKLALIVEPIKGGRSRVIINMQQP